MGLSVIKATLRLTTKNIVAAVNAIRKWKAKPSAAVAPPPLNDGGPSQPAAIPCSRRDGFTPLGHQVMKAAVMSMHPQSKPAKKMAGNAREGCAPAAAWVEEVMLGVPGGCDATLSGYVVFSNPALRDIFTKS